MVKLFGSRTKEHRIAELEARVRDLEEENARLRDMHLRSWTTRDGRAQVFANPSIARTSNVSVQRVDCTRASSNDSSTASYLRPTAASERHKAKKNVDENVNQLKKSIGDSSSPALVRDEESHRLLIPYSERVMRLSKRTTTSSLKAGIPVEIERDPYRFSKWNPPSEFVDQHAVQESESDYDGPHGWLCYCKKCQDLETAGDDTTDHSLKIRSCLDGRKIPQESIWKLPVPFRIENRLLRRAYTLAQETLWVALRTHWPLIQRRHYLEGPEQVRFGLDELERVFGDLAFQSQANDMCDQPRSRVNYAIRSVTYLRNAVCHPGPNPNGTRGIDSLLADAHSLAVVLQDETRAFKINKLREELRAHAMATFEAIELRVGTYGLPYSKPWPLYLQRFFEGLMFYDHMNRWKSYPRAVQIAAMDWKSKHCKAGELDPAYQANVARAKSYVVWSTDLERRPSLEPFQVRDARSRRRNSETALETIW